MTARKSAIPKNPSSEILGNHPKFRINMRNRANRSPRTDSFSRSGIYFRDSSSIGLLDFSSSFGRETSLRAALAAKRRNENLFLSECPTKGSNSEVSALNAQATCFQNINVPGDKSQRLGGKKADSDLALECSTLTPGAGR
jgi:hypothetical protein